MFRQTDSTVKKRKSNIELLRIVAMLMIVMHHYAVHGGWAFTPEMSGNKLFLQLFSCGGKIGVDIFVIITGYFMITSSFKLKKLWKLVSQIWFYGLLILAFAVYKHLDSVNFANVVHSVLPLGQTNWFAYTYLLLYIFIPFLNPCLQGLERRIYRLGLMLATVIWFLIPTIYNIWPKLPYLDMGLSPLLMFFYLYALGAYLRMYGHEFFKDKAGKMIVLGFGGILAGYLLVDFLMIAHHSFEERVFYFSGDNIFALCAGCGLFVYFAELNMSYHKYINLLASTTFGIYLLHDSDLLRTYLWHHVFHNADLYTSAWLPVHAVSTVLIVFFCGAVIDYLRIALFECPFITRLFPLCDRWQERFRSGAALPSFRTKKP